MAESQFCHRRVSDTNLGSVPPSHAAWAITETGVYTYLSEDYLFPSKYTDTLHSQFFISDKEPSHIICYLIQ